MSQYMILVYDNETAMAEAGEQTFGQLVADHGAFAEEHSEILRGGGAVHPSTTAVSIRRDDDPVDGPFHPTQETLGGYYVIEAAGMDEAVAIAQRVPTRFGGVEVRALRDLG